MLGVFEYDGVWRVWVVWGAWGGFGGDGRRGEGEVVREGER